MNSFDTLPPDKRQAYFRLAAIGRLLIQCFSPPALQVRRELPSISVRVIDWDHLGINLQWFGLWRLPAGVYAPNQDHDRAYRDWQGKSHDFAPSNSCRPYRYNHKCWVIEDFYLMLLFQNCQWAPSIFVWQEGRCWILPDARSEGSMITSAVEASGPTQPFGDLVTDRHLSPCGARCGASCDQLLWPEAFLTRVMKKQMSPQIRQAPCNPCQGVQECIARRSNSRREQPWELCSRSTNFVGKWRT